MSEDQMRGSIRQTVAPAVDDLSEQQRQRSFAPGLKDMLFQSLKQCVANRSILRIQEKDIAPYFCLYLSHATDSVTIALGGQKNTIYFTEIQGFAYVRPERIVDALNGIVRLT